MLPLSLLTMPPAAFAGDVGVYERTMELVDERYLWPQNIDHRRMFLYAAKELADSVEWLLVEDNELGVTLRAGDGRWSATVPFTGRLPEDLAALEDAVRAAGRPLDSDLDLRVELLDGALDTLDRHTVVLAAKGLQRFDERLSGTLVGIGITLSRVDEGLAVTEVFPHGPADDAGLREGDLVLTIDGVPTTGMRATDATNRIRGAAGTHVELGLGRNGANLRVGLTRRELSIPNVRARVDNHGVGFLTIDHFSEKTTDWLQESLDELADDGALQNGVVLDLRDNTGGSLIQSARAADAFLQRGVIVRTEGRDGGHVPGLIQHIDARADYPPYAMPVVVMMNAATASGSEILAGALAQLDHALLIGDMSFGKGTVQTLYPLDEGIKLKLTVAEYVLPGDRHIHGLGLSPDVQIVPWKFGRSGVWYPAARGTPAPLVVADVQESPGWGDGRRAGEGPLVTELASSIARAATDPSREALLRAAEAVTPAVAARAEAELQQTLAEGGIDWAPGPIPDRAPELDVSVVVRGEAQAGSPIELHAQVVNRGVALSQVALRLRAIDALWEDLVFPIGRLDEGGTGIARATVDPRAGQPGRADEVEIWLEGRGLTPRLIGRTILEVAGEPAPSVAVDLRVTGEGTERRLIVDLTNRGERPLTGVRTELDFPASSGVTLAGEPPEPTELGARRSVRLELPLHLAESAPPTLPLSLRVENDAFGRLQQFDVDLNRDGAAVHLEAPVVHLKPPPLRAAPGVVTLSARVTDEDAIDHVLVYNGTERIDRARREPAVIWSRRKVAWTAMTGRRGELTVEVPVTPGSNHLRVVAVDRQGNRTSRDAWVWGTADPAVALEGG